MGRKTAYVFISFLGFVVGVIIYVIGVLILPWIIETFPVVARMLTQNRRIIEALISGFIGSILSVVVAYIWASKTSV